MERDPSRVTRVTFWVDWSGPASAMGAVLTTVTTTVSVSVPPRPSSTRRMKAYVPLLVAVKVGMGSFSSDRVTPGGAVHVYVRVSPSGSNDRRPSSTTRTFLTAFASTPASAVGGRLTTDTVTSSTSVPPKPSSTVRANMYVPAAVGVKEGVAVLAPARATSAPAVWFQEYVDGSPSGALDPAPFRVPR